MIIDNTNNFIFVHVYRTGGSSIDRAFGGNTKGYDTHTKLEAIPHSIKYFSFGFIRNPWDRTVSSYHYATAKKKINGTFEDYVRSFVGQDTKKLAQYNMVNNCSFVGRFEYLQEDFNQICDLIEIERITLPHVWKTDHAHYSEYYNDELKEIVYNHQSGDIENFGFTFDSTATKLVGQIR
jgi:hypothetical protein